MPKYICEISTSSWFYYKEICYDVRSNVKLVHITSVTHIIKHVLLVGMFLRYTIKF